MTHTYQISGMTCSSCEAKVKDLLVNVPGVTEVNISKDQNEAEIVMDKHISLNTFKEVLAGTKYDISVKESHEMNAVFDLEESRGWIQTYKPVLLIFVFITLVTIAIQLSAGQFDWMEWMQHFMAGFFLVFSFFKLLNLKGFAESYGMYDIIARRFRLWGYFYAVLELLLGMAYLVNFEPLLTNGITFTVMTLSIIGVLQSVLNKRKIQCACLGAVFNLPMSTITIIEDALMIVMSGVMVVMLW